MIDLRANRLNRMPNSVLRTFNTSLRLTLLLYGRESDFCPCSRTCNCCDFVDFGQWLKENRNTFEAFDVQCGGIGLAANNLHSVSLGESCVVPMMILPTTEGTNRSLPHLSCTYCDDCGPGNPTDQLRCNARGIDPAEVSLNDFSFPALPLTVQRMEIAYFVYSTNLTAPCLVPEFPSMPDRPQLSDIALHGDFRRMTDLDVFPFNRLLAGNRHHIVNMTLNFVKLVRLTESNFAGFSQLERLDLYDCMISIIDADVFESLGVMPGLGLKTNFSSILSNLKVESNSIRRLNWAFLRPISDSVQVRMGKDMQLAGHLMFSQKER